MGEHDLTVLATLRQVPDFAGLQADECQITRLGGLTNLVHRVQARGQAVIVRIPGEGTESYIDPRPRCTTPVQPRWQA